LLSQLLSDKVAVITGGGRGIGRAVALAFAGEGAHVALIARSEDQLQSTASEINALGRKTITCVADVTERDQVDAAASVVKEAFGAIDILFNNAGGGIEPAQIAQSDPDLWIRDVQVNLFSAYLVTRAFLPLFGPDGGKIINTGSGMGHRSGPGSSAYHVGKAGLWMFTQCLAEEIWERGIEVNELIPGPVATHLTKGRMEPGGPPPFTPSERVKTPEEVAPLALWLASQPPGGPSAQSFSLTRRPI
jgi:3-oxoacyl-[acyl-carrier protein] reductase